MASLFRADVDGSLPWHAERSFAEERVRVFALTSLVDSDLLCRMLPDANICGIPAADVPIPLGDHVFWLYDGQMPERESIVCHWVRAVVCYGSWRLVP